MLCPEVVNFKAPESHFKISKPAKREDVLKENVRFDFNHSVCAVLPDVLNVPNSIISKLVDDSEYYKIFNLVPSRLLDVEFISGFVLHGKLSLLTVGRRIDCDDCLAVTSEGLLILNLRKETYQRLGLEGKVSHFYAKNKERYVVKIDLTDTTNLHPEKPFYKRAKRCLDNLNPFTAIITWRPPSPDICPSSIAKYFSDLKFKVSECAPTLNSDTVYSTKVPAIDFDIVEPDDVEDVVEWLGMVAVDADLNMQGGPGNYVSSYVTPEPNYEVGQVKVLKFRGFFVREKVEEFVKEVLMISGRKFVAVFVQGFSDSPVSWCGKENHFYTSVDNGCLFIFDKEKGVFCEHSVSQKRYK